MPRSMARIPIELDVLARPHEQPDKPDKLVENGAYRNVPIEAIHTVETFTEAREYHPRDRTLARLQAHRPLVRMPDGSVVRWPPFAKLKPGCAIAEPTAIDVPLGETPDGTVYTERDVLLHRLETGTAL